MEKDRAWREYMTEREHPPMDDGALFSCGAGKNSLHVDPYGNVQVCLMVKNFRHSLREKPLERIYREDFPAILAIEREEASKCGGCAHRVSCNNCPGMALWETRSNQSHVEFACQLSTVRAKTYAGALAEAAAPQADAGCGTGGCSAGGSGGLLQIGGLP